MIYLLFWWTVSFVKKNWYGIIKIAPITDDIYYLSNSQLEFRMCRNRVTCAVIMWNSTHFKKGLKIPKG